MARFSVFSYVTEQFTSARDYLSHKQENLEKKQELCILDALSLAQATNEENISVEKIYHEVSFQEIFGEKKELERTTFRLAAKNLVKLYPTKNGNWSMSMTSQGLEYMQEISHFSFKRTAGEWASNFGQVKFVASVVLTVLCGSLIFIFDVRISSALKNIPLFSSVVDVSLVEQMEKINEEDPIYKVVKKAISTQLSWKNISKMEPIKNKMLAKDEHAFLLTQKDGKKLVARLSQEQDEGKISVFAFSETTGVLKPLFNFPIVSDIFSSTQKLTY